MPDIPGIPRPELQTLPQIKDRISFLYLEHCIINRQDGAITVTDARGTVLVPAASLGVLLLGPGSNISHRAMELIGDAGASTVWVGERGVRYYAHGRTLAYSSHLLVRQAALVSNVRSRVAVARRMYQLRFPNEDVSSLTMQQLRGREGSRVRTLYRNTSKATGVPWNGRQYDPSDFDGSDAVNKALSAAHACLYGVAQSVIVALGCSPGLGFIHTGNARSFVFDIADLYKASITIPISFEIAAEQPEDIGAVTRRRVRDALADGHVLENMVKDIRWLLQSDDSTMQETDSSPLYLWDDKLGLTASATNYGQHVDTTEEDELREGYGRLLEGVK